MGDDKWVYGKTERLDKFYDLGKPIGEPGQFGQAYLVTHKATKEVRAVKVISKQKFRSEQDRDFHFRQLRDEIAILTEMSHPNIIKFYEVFESAGHLYIVMECCKGGELFDRIRSQKSGAYSEKDAVGVLRQIISGLKYMHEKGIAHCDLKPDNFLFLTQAPDSPLKIIDFGMSKHIQRRKYLTSFRGTPYYVAPEVLEGKYAESCDIWSFGVVMFVMLFGFPPFHANSDEEIFKKIRQGFENKTKKGYGNWFPQSIVCSEDAKDLIARCLTLDKSLRLTAGEVLEHKFMNGGASATPFVATVAQNLREFCANTQFKVQVLSMMGSMLDQDELGNLKRVFQEIDANGDGQITTEELREAFKSRSCRQGMKDSELMSQVENLMKLGDVNGDGVLSYEELVMTSVQRKLANKEERLWEAFCKFDKDMDGTITATEIAEVLKVSKAEAEALIKEIDKNGDKVVDYEEFSQMMMGREEMGLAGLAQGMSKLAVSAGAAAAAATATAAVAAAAVATSSAATTTTAAK